MSEPRPTDLLYGHTGEAIYDTERRRWYFTRIPRITRSIKLVGQPSVILQPSIGSDSLTNIQDSVQRTQNIKKLTHLIPELVPGLSLLPELTKKSELVDYVSSRHDPSTSILLAFGQASDDSSKHGKSRSSAKEVPIVAVVGGAAGEIVRLIRLRKELLGWEGKHDVRLRDYSLIDEERCWWSGNGSPVQQVCFSKSTSKSKFLLAVRYHGATTILQPTLVSNEVFSWSQRPYSVKGQHPPSMLDANPIFTLPVEKTGRSPHADVSFNPWNTLQFAIIDQQGHWTIWCLERIKQQKHEWKVIAGPSGYVSDGYSNVDKTHLPTAPEHRKDNWGAILWAGDENTIIVADRRTLSVVCLADGSVDRIDVPELALSKNASWILDLQASPSDDRHFFLATSTRVMWMHLLPAHQHRSVENPKPRASVLLSWMHFRDQDDTSLRLNLLDDQGTTMVVLYSRFTGLSTVFTFELSPSGIPLSASDPYILPSVAQLPLDNISPNLNIPSSAEQPLSSITLRAINYEDQTKSTPSGLGAFYQTKNVKFFQLSILCGDLSLTQCLYAGQPAPGSIPIHSPRFQACPDALEGQAISFAEDFIVPNTSVIDYGNDLSTEIYSESDDTVDATANIWNAEEDPLTLNFEWLERGFESCAVKSSTPNKNKSHSRSLGKCIELVRSATVSMLNTDAPTIKSFFEISSPRILVEDVDTASASLTDLIKALQELFTEFEDNDNKTRRIVRVSNLLTPSISTALLPSPRASTNLVLSQVYDSLVESWLSSLPETTPNRVRVATERTVREIATQLCLASFGVRVISTQAEAKVVDVISPPQLDGPFNLPVRQKSSFHKRAQKPQLRSQERASPPLASSQISTNTDFLHLPTPETTHFLPPTYPPAFPIDPASQRLRSLAALAPQPLLPPSATNILQHWNLGHDPAAYDWEAMENALRVDSDDDPDEEENITKTTKRARMKKRRKRSRETTAAASSPADTPAVTNVKPGKEQESNAPTRLGLSSSSQEPTLPGSSHQRTRGIEAPWSSPRTAIISGSEAIGSSQRPPGQAIIQPSDAPTRRARTRKMHPLRAKKRPPGF